MSKAGRTLQTTVAKLVKCIERDTRYPSESDYYYHYSTCTASHSSPVLFTGGDSSSLVVMTIRMMMMMVGDRYNAECNRG